MAINIKHKPIHPNRHPWSPVAQLRSKYETDSQNAQNPKNDVASRNGIKMSRQIFRCQTRRRHRERMLFGAENEAGSKHRFGYAHNPGQFLLGTSSHDIFVVFD
jgi:hypothetical protein